MGIYDMYDLAHYNEKKLYKEFGVNAEFLIDHAKGIETCTISDIKNYRPKTNSVSTSQVLFRDYNYQETMIVLKEMVELKSLELVEKHLTTDTINLYIGYSNNKRKSTGGNYKLSFRTNLYSELVKAFLELYKKTTFSDTPIRRIGISFLRVEQKQNEQLSFFLDEEKRRKERNLELTIAQVKHKIGLNAVIKGMDLQEAATTKIRNKLVGGHNAI